MAPKASSGWDDDDDDVPLVSLVKVPKLYTLSPTT